MKLQLALILSVVSCVSVAISVFAQYGVAQRIDELAYWRQLRSSGVRSDLHQGLMLKPRYRQAYLNGTPARDIKSQYGGDPAAEERWIQGHQSLERSFRPETNPPISISGYPIDAFVGYRSGNGRFIDEDGICYKVFFDFDDPLRDLTPEAYLNFVRALAKAGFVGDSKVAMTPGFARFNYNDIIVHTPSPELGKLAERVGLEFWRGKISHYSRGVDVNLTKVGDRWTDIVDWHTFLSQNSDLSRLSTQANKYVSFND